MHPLWTTLATTAGRELSEQQIARLSRYLDLLAEANTRMNLTRIVDREQASVAHVGDALTLLRFLPKGTFAMADIGSGGGVPGVPLAIVCPEAQITLIEATQKKAAFLTECAKQLELPNMRVLPVRAEEAGRGPLRETLDIVTARAVGELAFLIEWGVPLLKKGGKLLAMKGAKAAEEIAGSEWAIKMLRTSQPTVHPVELPGAEHHVIVELTKLGKADDKYPRAATVAKGKPLR